MRDEIDHASAHDAASGGIDRGIDLHHRDFLTDAANLPDGSIDLIVADPPYGLGKDYGNDSDMRSGDAFLDWTYGWLDLAIPKLKPSGRARPNLVWMTNHARR